MTAVTDVQPALAPRFPALDTMRAVGAVAVLTTHSAFWAGDYTRHGVLGTLLARMDVGVSIFFVLSGFLLSRPHLARKQAGIGAPAVGDYLWKRFLRIFPVYALTVVIALSLIEENQGATVWYWVKTLLLMNVYVDTSLPAGLTQMWSLSVEVAFYLALPGLLLLGLGRTRGLRAGRLGLLLVALVALSVWWHLDLAGRFESGLPLQWLPAYLSWFAVGIALALAHVLHTAGGSRGPLLSGLVSLARHPGSCWVIAGGVLLVSATPLAGPTMLAAATPEQSLTKSVTYAIVGGLLILPGVFPVENSPYLRVMSLKPLRHLGLISYGIFCIHLPLLHLVMAVTGYTLFDGHLLQIWTLTLASAIVVSEMIYRVLERPAMRLKRPRALGGTSSASRTAPARDTITR